jgi:hypothetical protein
VAGLDHVLSLPGQVEAHPPFRIGAGGLAPAGLDDDADFRPGERLALEGEPEFPRLAGRRDVEGQFGFPRRVIRDETRGIPVPVTDFLPVPLEGADRETGVLGGQAFPAFDPERQGKPRRGLGGRKRPGFAFRS